VKMFVLLSAICLLSACSHAQVPKQSRVAASSEVVTCRTETPTGSHRPRTVCTSRTQRQKQEQEGRSFIDETKRSGALEDQWRANAGL
jgi:hypothetical protein